MSDTEGCFTGLAFGLVAAVLLAFYVDGCSQKYVQRQAVEKGHAQYVLDPATGETTWEWLPKGDNP